MKINENENALKGQQIIAQGNALGLWASSEIVRAMTFIKEKFMFRTKKMASGFPKMMSCNSVRGELFALFIEFPRTVFLLHPLPRATFRIVPPSTLPWAELYWPFRPEKHML
ncbi:MAG TPA: hypothetical protein VF373_09190 [Prolixibacteraceae bacterium]